MFDNAFWRKFIELDMREEARMMHEEVDLRMVHDVSFAGRMG